MLLSKMNTIVSTGCVAHESFLFTTKQLATYYPYM